MHSEARIQAEGPSGPVPARAGMRRAVTCGPTEQPAQGDDPPALLPRPRSAEEALRPRPSWARGFHRAQRPALASSRHEGQRLPGQWTQIKLSDPHKRPVTVPKHSGGLNAGIWPHAVLLTPGHSTFLKELRATRLPPGHSDGRRTDMGTGGCTPGCSLLRVVASRAPTSPRSRALGRRVKDPEDAVPGP